MQRCENVQNDVPNTSCRLEVLEKRCPSYFYHGTLYKPENTISLLLLRDEMLPFGSYDELPLPFEHQSTSENQLNYAPHYDIQTIIPIAEYEESSPRNSSPPDDVSSPFSDEKTYKSLPRNKCPSKCLVCRNAAIGYHYDVPSCNGCKTFFRRTILSGRRFTCTKAKNCLDGVEPIDMSKRLCRACRFAKCVAVGMNPMAIQSAVKSQEGNVLRKEVLNQRKSMGVVSSLMATEEDLLSRMIEKLSIVESKVEPLHRSGIPAGYNDMRTLEEILDMKPVFAVSEIPKLQFYASACVKSGKPRHRGNNYVHTSFLASVESTKMFDFSAHLDLASKVILVKHATIACSNMMNAFFSMYQMKSDVLLHPDGRLAGAMKKRDRENDVWSEHTRLLQKTLISFLSNKIDKIEYLLFKAIMLCNPAVPGLSIFDQQVIEKERNQYMKALLNYCFLQHGTLNGPARFAAIIALAPVIEGQSKQQRDFHVWLKATHFHKHQKLTDRNRKCLSGMFNEIMES